MGLHFLELFVYRAYPSESDRLVLHRYIIL